MKILLTTHGKMCEGIYDSYQMIAGENDRIYTLQLDDKGIDVYRKRLTNWLNKFELEDILILCDLKGGTPFNESYIKYLEQSDRIKVISGLNLPMLIEVGIMSSSNNNLVEMANLAVSIGKQGVQQIFEDNENAEMEF